MDSGKTKICHICSYCGNKLFVELVEAQMERTDPRIFFFKQYGEGNCYHKDFIDEVECYSPADRLFFFPKAHKAYRKYKQIYVGGGGL